MSLSKTLTGNRVHHQCKTRSDGKTFIEGFRAKRPPLTLEERNKDKKYFSEIIFDAFVEEGVGLASVTLSMVHYLRREDSIELSEYQNVQKFFAQEPFFSWSIDIFPGKTGGRFDIKNLVLYVETDHCSEELDYFEAYFERKVVKTGLIAFYIPLYLIESVVFQENVQKP